MDFNEDGSLNVPPKKHRDHITIFNLIDELDFKVGKKLLIDILRGQMHSKITKHKLNEKIYHGSLGGYEEEELSLFLDYLTNLNFIIIKREKGLYPVYHLTQKAKLEAIDKELTLKVDGIKDETIIKRFPKTEITEQDKLLFKEFDFFLNGHTEEQKKAITSMAKKQLCIAGAGSGKTSVLTNKIAFLVKFAGIDPKEVLAITFTRKARQEMIARLGKLMPDKQVRIETFNSFAEKEISYHSLILYGKEKRMASSKDFMKLVTKSLLELGFTFEQFLSHYFTKREQRGKDPRQLFFSFLYDFSSIMDSYIREGKNNLDFDKRSYNSNVTDRMTAKTIAQLVKSVSDKLEDRSLRIYSDQLIDIIKLYKNHEHVKKTYKWVLVDEYQDVNTEQIELLNLIATENLFVVGDPRQSIFAWRGAEPQRIYDFGEKDTEVIQLTVNFRSNKHIVDFSNSLIGELGFEPCTSNSSEEGSVMVTKYTSEDSEARSIVNEILALQISRKEVFVLSRTNKGLESVRRLCDKSGIRYVLRTDEKKNLSVDPLNDQITLSTVHAIKGLEAKVVYVIGANYQNYPCKAKDHRFVELFASTKEYDQIQEEKRLLYVACTRAKNLLRITHTASLTPFVSKSAMNSISIKAEVDVGSEHDINITKQQKALKRWRFLESKDRGIASYAIMSDKMLDQLLDLQPRSVDELEFIIGFNPKRIAEFGFDLINILERNV